MKHSTRLVLAGLALLLTACSLPSVMPWVSSLKPSGSEDRQINAFFERVYQEDLANRPERQSYRGIKTNYDKWDDRSEAESDRRIAAEQARLEELKSFDFGALSPSRQLSYRLFERQTTRRIEVDEFRHTGYAIHHKNGIHTRVPSFLINIHKVTDLSDARAWVKRLEGVPELFDQVIIQTQMAADNSVYAPDWSYPRTIESARNVITGAPFDTSGKDSTLLNDIKTKLANIDGSDEDKAAVLVAAHEALLEAVEPAYLKLIGVLEEQSTHASGDDGIWQVPNGAAYYNMKLRHYTTTDLTAAQVHQMGLDNVARIHDEMRQIMKKVKFDGSLQEFFEFMRTDPQFFLPSTDEGRAEYLANATNYIDVMRARLPEAFGILPKADIRVKRVEPFRERSAGKAFYQSPAIDGSRPGTYYANLYNMEDMPLYQAAALAYHEGIPGHHMQRSIQQELKGVPSFQKFSGFTAYTEGWGLYTEYLPKEMGFYEDPYSDFGRLAMELWRACRLVVDTGMHDKKWTREQAIQYQVDNTPNSMGDIVKAIERYAVNPGQATAYLIGKLKIVEVREKARAEMGDRFDIRAFHDEVLKDGPVPLDILEEKIEAWSKS